MNWLLVALAGHFANALAFVVDKILLSGRMQRPGVYVFFIGTLGLLGFVLLPFGELTILPVSVLVTAFIAGASFMAALLAFFNALQQGETTRVVPAVGALVPLWTILFAAVTLGETVSSGQLSGIALLIIGAVVISYERGQAKRLGYREAYLTVLAAGLFALSYTLTKVVFNQTTFIDGFLWMRLAAFSTVVPLLMVPGIRQAIFARGGTRPSALFYVGQAFGALGFVLLNFAVALAPQVSVVNALQGVQYAFLFILAVFVNRFFPGAIHERITRTIVLQKVFALFVLSFGLYLVA
ncbi:MAG: EamA family transporter [Patescibacteria group bacterium]